jgi:hypothetical protein
VGLGRGRRHGGRHRNQNCSRAGDDLCFRRKAITPLLTQLVTALDELRAPEGVDRRAPALRETQH